MRDTGAKIENANFPPANQSPIWRVSVLMTISVSKRMRLMNFWSETLVVVEKTRGVARAAKRRIVGDDPALPLGIKQIPVRLDLRGIHEFCVEGDDHAIFAVDVEQILVLRVDVVKLSAPPTRRVGHFRKHELRRYRIERFRFIKNIVT